MSSTKDNHISETGKEPTGEWDHSTHSEFYDYYSAQSFTEATFKRFRHLRDTLLEVCAQEGKVGPFEIADIGGGAGTSAIVWAEVGHRARCLDVNRSLVELGKRRAVELGLSVRFDVGSATSIPWEDASVDICLVPELLEHVAEWKACMDEFARILRPGGLLFISTTNKLCPRQSEFNLPLYSWYPERLKRHFERLAVTTRPSLANYAKYPAVNWFTFYSLRQALACRGFVCFMDRFDLASSRNDGPARNAAFFLIRRLPGCRAIGQVLSPSARIAAFKGGSG